MPRKNVVKQVLFALVYVPLATAVLIYLLTGGNIGGDAMLEAAILPWWLPLIATPSLLILVILGLGIFDLDEYL